MRGIGSATQGHEHTPFQIECSMRLALEAVSPCDAEFCRQNGFTQISEEPRKRGNFTGVYAGEISMSLWPE